MLHLTPRFFRLSCLLSVPLTLAIATILPVAAQVSDSSDPKVPDSVELEDETEVETTDSEDASDLNNMRPLAQPDSLLSLQAGQKLMEEASGAIDDEKYELAAQKLQEARQVFNQLSNFHLQLANSFSGIDNRILEEQRNSALKTGQMRDNATYQLALVHRAQNQPELAVPLLIQVIRSQNPSSELGKKSYQQLYELGFVEAPQSTSEN